MDSNIHDEDFASFDECTSTSGSSLHQNNYGSDYICIVYHNEHVTHSGFDLNTTDNSYHVSPQHMIKDPDYEALHPYLLCLPIDHIKHTLHSGFLMHTTFQFTNILCHIPILPASLIIMNQSPLTLCSPMSLH